MSIGKGIAICGIWATIPLAIYFAGPIGIWLGLFAMIATCHMPGK